MLYFFYNYKPDYDNWIKNQDTKIVFVLKVKVIELVYVVNTLTVIIYTRNKSLTFFLNKDLFLSW